MIIAATVVDVFLEQAQRTPDAPALKYGYRTLTYRQLDEQSNQLAHQLIVKGIRPGTLVPICLSSPYDMVVGIWGILKTGAAYVPIDAEFPVERIRYMIDDTGATLVISDSKSTQFITAAGGKNIFLADDDWAIVHGEPANHVGVMVSAADVAYVIYTSGSTGNPKGVLIEHRSVADYIGGLFAHLPYADCKSFALGVSFAADSVITHLFGSVWSGGALHVFSKEDYNNVDYIHDYFASHKMDCLKAVPSHWKSLSRNGVELLPRKVLMFGGEALHTAVVKDIIPESARNCVIVNHYGPTETTVGQLMHRITEGNAYGHTIPIGETFTDALVYILDEDGNEVVNGEHGELHISGTCVARGYLNRPDLTAQRFVHNHFSSDPAARMYRTGDLVRRLPGGDIEFLDRIDDQVKIRGYRIELGEIENVLQKAPGVKQCVVVAKEGANGDKRLVGYVVCPAGAYNKKMIVGFLEQTLPAFMVPQLLMQLDEMPFLPNGKVDKKALPNPDASTLLTNDYQAPGSKTEKLISDILRDVLAVERAGADDHFFELGGTSLLALKTVALLKALHGIQIPITRLYQYPRIKDLAAFIDGKALPRKTKTVAQKKSSSDVAVIGMAGRFPGADSIDELWDVLKNGKETTTFFKDYELDASVPSSLHNNPAYVRARGIVRDVKGFDAAFFGISPKQAELMDPQQRIFLQIAWEALEQAGYAPGKYEGAIGVFAGVRFNTYLANNVLPNTELVENIGQLQVITLNDKDYVATRSAYALNLKGPAVNVQSACSTSLVAIAQAAESIRQGQCDMALAGGATINSPVNVGHLYNEGAMLSADGHCRPFDADATGTVFSDGAGVVLLKNMDDAVRDGDTIFAVIKGVGLSNDGGGKGSFTAPSAEGQAAAISMAIADAGIDPSHISYIETHGTATPLGDPIEIDGLNIAFGDQSRKQYCAIGSVKSNFGHLTTSAGVAGFIKTCLLLHNRQLVPSLNYNTPNPHIDFANSPFFVNTALANWDVRDRIAGVSSFGVGGTNAHVILAGYEQPKQIAGSTARPAQLLCWSAKSVKSLDAYGDKLASYLQSDSNFADVAYTLNTSREDFDHRRFVIAGDAQDFVAQASNKIQFHANTKHVDGKTQNIVFMFPGQGDQYVNMCRSLYDTETVFREAMNECAELLKHELNENILDIIYPQYVTDEATTRINNTAYSQPALFAIGYALGKLWMSWGVYPSAFAGHSIGEFVAAYFSGVFSLKDALRLIATRGRMMGSLPRGSMLSVRLNHDSIQAYLSPEIALAATNSPQLSVVAGTSEAIEKLSATLNDKGILNRILATSHAFHSHMMEAVVTPFETFASGITLNAPLIPIMSTVTGEWLKAEEATKASYWARHLRATVFFGRAIQSLLDNSYGTFLELGPGKSVATLARQQAGGKPITAISSIEKQETEQPSQQLVLKALGQLWLNGIAPDWKAFYKEETRQKRIDLPTYAFNNQDYWVDPPARFTAAPMHVTMPLHTIDPISSTNSNDLVPMARKPQLIEKIRFLLEDASGIDMSGATPDMSFIEMGLDSLLLTQVALMLKKQFAQPITFRQLNEDLGTLDLLADHLDVNLPAEAIRSAPTQQPFTPVANGGSPLDMISMQLQQLAAQVSMLQHGHSAAPVQYHTVPQATTPMQAKTADLTAEEELEIKKPFGAAARIEKHSAALSESQQEYLMAFTEKYNEKTKGSKAYTQKHRAQMADPRVVSGFRPATKELVYSIVIKKSKGSRLWDIDGNEYIDSLNGFGSNMLGYQPDVLKNALIDQIEKGYEIGPQHELAGEVCERICAFTGFDRAALCNTGSEAVLGAMRIARTVTGRSIIVAFAGSYHGITDEVIVRGSKKLKSYPASPGIMPGAVQNMLILDYGTDETLRIIEERAHEIAAVLVEPIQSRRCDFQPIAFLKRVREVTKKSKTVLIFDEVISGFRFHPGGAQAIFGIRADLATYGKVVGGGLSIGVVAGDKEYMDCLDGGWWQYGDDSIPEVGVTYFAGTFVRHPLVLATAKASLDYFKEAGPQLQEGLNAKGLYMATTINALCHRLKVPMFIAQFGSLWRIRFLEEYSYMELFFTLMRYKGIHIQEGFPCFITAAHTDADLQTIVARFEESLTELKEAGLIPEYEHAPTDENKNLNVPPVLGARLGKDKDGNPAWFVKDEANPGKYMQVI